MAAANAKASPRAPPHYLFCWTRCNSDKSLDPMALSTSFTKNYARYHDIVWVSILQQILHSSFLLQVSFILYYCFVSMQFIFRDLHAPGLKYCYLCALCKCLRKPLTSIQSTPRCAWLSIEQYSVTIFSTPAQTIGRRNAARTFNFRCVSYQNQITLFTIRHPRLQRPLCHIKNEHSLFSSKRQLIRCVLW